MIAAVIYIVLYCYALCYKNSRLETKNEKRKVINR